GESEASAVSDSRQGCTAASRGSGDIEMKKTLVAGALAALTLVAGGGVALAQQSPDRPQARSLRADADGDQRLSRAEFIDSRIARLGAADADGDGPVPREERSAA